MEDEQVPQSEFVQPENNETGNAPGGEAPKPVEKSGEKLFTQADLDRQIDDRLKREREKAQKAQEKATAEAEERQKVAQGEWQKVAEERKAKLDELSPKSELADRLSDMVGKQLDAEIAAWPESVRAIMPNGESSLLERLEWAERTRPLAKELLAAKGPNGTPYPSQFPGTGGEKPATMKETAQNTLNKAYAPRKAAT